jgi:hypothetical protein
MFHIQYKRYLAFGLIMLISSTATKGEQDLGTPGIYFAPPGQSVANQNHKRPEEIGMRPEIIAKLKAKMRSNPWALWRRGRL